MTTAQEINADVVIIGSGVAGALTACRLASKGIRNIVILEAGPRVARADVVRKFQTSPVLDLSSGYPNADWAPRPASELKDAYFECTGPEQVRFEYLRVVGGTTWHWSGDTPRHLPVDFRLKSAYGVGRDWPFAYEALEPYYSEAEHEIGVGGDSSANDGSPRSKPYPMPPAPFSYYDKIVAEGLKKIGISTIPRAAARATTPYMGRGQCQGFGTCSPICPSGALYSAIYHVERAEKLGVRVLENTRVDRIVADGAAKYVEAKKPDGNAVIVRGKLFVLAANGMETPRILLMSVSEKYPKGLANTSGQVGRNFMEHPTLFCRLQASRPVWAGRGPQSLSYSPDFRDGSFRGKRPSFLLSLENLARFHDIAVELLNKRMEPPLLDETLKHRVIHEIQLYASHEQLPDPDNRITLDWDKRDKAGQPKMMFHYSFGDYERAGFAHAKDDFKRMAQALGAEITDIAGPVPINHPMGMTVMGDDPKTSVTDSFGRCHDHNNLFVVSSSLFPASGTANPTLTIAALALRAADEIARQLAG